jgi:hypothetical protein
MAAQIRPVLVMSKELFDREKSTFCKCGVETTSGVSFTKHKAIAVETLRRRGIDV